MKRFSILGAVVLLGCMTLGRAADTPCDEDAKLAAFFRTSLDRMLQGQPLEATRLGDHRFDDRLEDLSPAARARRLDQTRETLDALRRTVNYDQLSRAAQVDFDILQHDLQATVWLAENTRPYEEDPRVYNSYLNESVYLLLTQSSLPPETNVVNALARMSRMPDIVAAARANLTRPPRVHAETAIRQNRGAVAFYERDLFALAGRTRHRAALQAAARDVVVCLKSYQQFLESELLPRADGDWRLGPAKFAQKLALTLQNDQTADQVLAEAEREFERVQNEMYALARQLWSRYQPGKVLPPDDDAGHRATVRHVLDAISQEHGRPDQLTRDAKRTVAGIKRFIRSANVLALPEPDRCRVIEMPEFQRGNATAYMNSPPPLDPTAAGYFAVSPPPKDWEAARVRSFLEEYNRYMLQILTIHEAYPGHYVQYEYANRNPSLIRRVLPSGVYVEGWAVYTEQTLLDQGYGAGDLPLRLTQLKFYLRAVANAILDHRMHCAGMSDDEALRVLVDGSYQSEGEAQLKVIRAKQSSTQLSTYFVGRMAHQRLRREMQRLLGDRFDLARYHEAVLAEGAVPVKYLPELVAARLGVARPGAATRTARLR
jgi:uncharacterized protein (DUF885 family)